MMKKSIICLANSYKERGRCLAGIEIFEGTPLMVNGRPKWIRPVSLDGHGELPTYAVNHVKILDIVEIEVFENASEGFQTENVSFDQNYLKIVGKYRSENLPTLCETKFPTLFGNKGRAVPPDFAATLDHSLLLIETINPVIVEKAYDGREKPKVKLEFNYNNIRYELPITDPAFLGLYENDKKIIEGKRVFSCLSLGIEHEGWHHKLVASLIVK